MKTRMIQLLTASSVFAVAGVASGTVVTLTADEANTSTPLLGQGSETAQLASLINDDFAYDPGNPTSPTPDNYSGPGDWFPWRHRWRADRDRLYV